MLRTTVIGSYPFPGWLEFAAANLHEFGPAHIAAAQDDALRAPRGLGTLEEWRRLQRLAPPGPALKMSVPGPYTLSGRLVPNADYPDRWALTAALLPIVSDELAALVEAGCPEITVDEPSMSCYGHREDPERFADIFNRTVAPAAGRTRLSTHLCFGNYKGHAVGLRRYAPLFPAFHSLQVD